MITHHVHIFLQVYLELVSFCSDRSHSRQQLLHLSIRALNTRRLESVFLRSHTLKLL